MLYATFLNGVTGIAYFAYRDFDTPMDFYYHAKALKTLRPYEALLWNGKALKLKSSNSKLGISAWGNDKEFLLFVDNYTGTNDATTNFELSLSEQASITDLATNKKLQIGEKLTLNLKGKRFMLLHIHL